MMRNDLTCHKWWIAPGSGYDGCVDLDARQIVYAPLAAAALT